MPIIAPEIVIVELYKSILARLKILVAIFILYTHQDYVEPLQDKKEHLAVVRVLEFISAS
ncbi:hypothetical protein HMP0015_1161 [Acinetobacter haemolyticus ATCC 19194]|uniref:Uncharacterized protein n=1 Tax=Acinetobacter haemolyticus ATCC 19194 TaxID=707232 RepID=D4XN69_ACIHA|nr:hypothetical protein HMP0015_1161 [Acinetobacter haemolyticus ATCC 19194]